MSVWRPLNISNATWAPGKLHSWTQSSPRVTVVVAVIRDQVTRQDLQEADSRAEIRRKNPPNSRSAPILLRCPSHRAAVGTLSQHRGVKGWSLLPGQGPTFTHVRRSSVFPPHLSDLGCSCCLQWQSGDSWRPTFTSYNLMHAVKLLTGNPAIPVMALQLVTVETDQLLKVTK